eukprot:1161529-Pelagomonas_calceolata.AAC.22
MKQSHPAPNTLIRYAQRLPRSPPMPSFSRILTKRSASLTPLQNAQLLSHPYKMLSFSYTPDIPLCLALFKGARVTPSVWAAVSLTGAVTCGTHERIIAMKLTKYVDRHGRFKGAGATLSIWQLPHSQIEGGWSHAERLAAVSFTGAIICSTHGPKKTMIVDLQAIPGQNDWLSMRGQHLDPNKASVQSM